MKLPWVSRKEHEELRDEVRRLQADIYDIRNQGVIIKPSEQGYSTFSISVKTLLQTLIEHLGLECVVIRATKERLEMRSKT